MKLDWPNLTWAKSSWPAHFYRACGKDGRRYELFADGPGWWLRMPSGTVRRSTAVELQRIADDFEKEARS